MAGRIYPTSLFEQGGKPLNGLNVGELAVYVPQRRAMERDVLGPAVFLPSASLD